MFKPFALGVVLSIAALPAFASDSNADDIDAYKQKMADCLSQLQSSHAEMSPNERKKSCKAQLGPSPKGVVPAKAPAPVL